MGQGPVHRRDLSWTLVPFRMLASSSASSGPAGCGGLSSFPWLRCSAAWRLAVPPAAPTGPANAVRLCGERAALLEQFAMQHDETPQALGLGADGGVIEVLVSPEGGWTMLVTYPARPTCVIAMGEAWETVQLVGDAS